MEVGVLNAEVYMWYDTEEWRENGEERKGR